MKIKPNENQISQKQWEAGNEKIVESDKKQSSLQNVEHFFPSLLRRSAVEWTVGGRVLPKKVGPEEVYPKPSPDSGDRSGRSGAVGGVARERTGSGTNEG